MGLLDSALGGVLGQVLGGGQGGSVKGQLIQAVLAMLLQGGLGGGRAGAAPSPGGGGLGDVLGSVLGGGRGAPQSGGGLGDVLGSVLGGAGGGQRPGGGLGDVLGAVLGQGGGQDGGLGGALSGGLGGLGQIFEQAGMGGHMKSWVSPGANQRISPDEVTRAFGRERLDDLARQAGISRDEAAGHLTDILPNLVDQMTPGGHMPHGGLSTDDLGSMVASVLGGGR